MLLEKLQVAISRKEGQQLINQMMTSLAGLWVFVRKGRIVLKGQRIPHHAQLELTGL